MGCSAKQESADPHHHLSLQSLVPLLCGTGSLQNVIHAFCGRINTSLITRHFLQTLHCELEVLEVCKQLCGLVGTNSLQKCTIQLIHQKGRLAGSPCLNSFQPLWHLHGFLAEKATQVCKQCIPSAGHTNLCELVIDIFGESIWGSCFLQHALREDAFAIKKYSKVVLWLIKGSGQSLVNLLRIFGQHLHGIILRHSRDLARSELLLLKQPVSRREPLSLVQTALDFQLDGDRLQTLDGRAHEVGYPQGQDVPVAAWLNIQPFALARRWATAEDGLINGFCICW
mmetsp:Transcript_2311/g.4829  ORF Transcript_2311/g.4829 Transcript_2311/m.4829 type:complete len:284 (+) Transcript_2311:1074-1925(+)